MFLKPGKTNKEERINFTKYWAEYVRNTPDKVWSKQQNILINSQLQNAKNISRSLYLKLKNEIDNRKD